jgi:hypothetical protein
LRRDGGLRRFEVGADHAAGQGGAKRQRARAVPHRQIAPGADTPFKPGR